MKSLVLFLCLVPFSSQAAWRHYMECVVIETSNGVETRMDPNPTVDFGYVGHGVLPIMARNALMTAEVHGADDNIMILARDQKTGTSITSHSMGVKAVAIMKMQQADRKLEVSCFIRKEN